MRKIMFLFAIVFTLVNFSGKSYANDVWVYGDKSINVYVMTETMEHRGAANYYVKAKTVFMDEQLRKIQGDYDVLGYAYTRNMLGGGRSNYEWVCSVDGLAAQKVENNPIVYAIFRYCNENL